MDPALAVVIAAFLGSGFLAAVAAKYFRPAPSLVETVTTMQTRLTLVEDNLRLTQDYVHVLRGEVSALGGTPAPWPAGLNP